MLGYRILRTVLLLHIKLEKHATSRVHFPVHIFLLSPSKLAHSCALWAGRDVCLRAFSTPGSPDARAGWHVVVTGKCTEREHAKEHVQASQGCSWSTHDRPTGREDGCFAYWQRPSLFPLLPEDNRCCNFTYNYNEIFISKKTFSTGKRRHLHISSG